MLGPMSVRRRSQRIVLVLIGTVALPACTPNTPGFVHDRYASLEDCSADWGRPDVCDREDDVHTSPGAFGRGILYRGPTYPAGDREQAQNQAFYQARRLGVLDQAATGPVSHAIEHGVPSRGGFGSSAHAFGHLG
jgi:uncharacterized protein YgiB involved in biofilm formation